MISVILILLNYYLNTSAFDFFHEKKEIFYYIAKKQNDL